MTSTYFSRNTGKIHTFLHHTSNVLIQLMYKYNFNTEKHTNYLFFISYKVSLQFFFFLIFFRVLYFGVQYLQLQVFIKTEKDYNYLCAFRNSSIMVQLMNQKTVHRTHSQQTLYSYTANSVIKLLILGLFGRWENLLH